LILIFFSLIPELVSTDGHFPNSSDPNFSKYLVMGPMTRFAGDLPLLTHIMSGENNNRLNFDDPQSLQTKDIKIFYREDAGFSFGTTAVDFDIKLALLRAKNYFQQQGAQCELAPFGDLQETLDMSIAVFFAMEDVPDFLVDPADPKRRDSLPGQIARSLMGRSKYSFASLLFLALYETGGFIPPSQRPVYKVKMDQMRQKMITALGTNGVFFFPTFPMAAPRHGTILTKVSGVMYSMFFNLVGFPSTHVPLGFDRNGLPIGIQVIAAPHQDRLCFGIAKELEKAFGGWVAPENRTK
jgi:fatty acid amide hydrolase 2